MPQAMDGLIVRFALRHGFISAEQAEDCLTRLAKAREAGETRPAEELLAERGLVQPAHVEVLRQRRLDSTARVPRGATAAAGGARSQAGEGLPLKAIGNFELIRELGTGAMGTVYLAKQKRMNRRVAVKVLAKDVARDAKAVMRFLEEARACGRLSHENVVAGIDAGEANGVFYLAQEYIDGVSVDDLIERHGSLDEVAALRVVSAVGRALEHISEHGLVHRDIKPANLLLTGEGVVKVCDFGLAKDLGRAGGLTADGVSVGTPHYISPEQARGETLDIRADIYSLGISLYHMLSGAPPFDEGSPYDIMLSHLNKPIPPLESPHPIRAEVHALLDAMLQKDREQRIDLKTLNRRLERLSATRGAPEARGKRGGRRAATGGGGRRGRASGPAPGRGRTALLVGAGVVALLAVVNIAYFMLRSPDGSSTPRVDDDRATSDGSGGGRKGHGPPASEVALARLQAKVGAARREGLPGLRRLVKAFDRLQHDYPADPAAAVARRQASALSVEAEEAVRARYGPALEAARKALAEQHEQTGLAALVVVPPEADFTPFGQAVEQARAALRDAMTARFGTARSAVEKALADGADAAQVAAAVKALAAVGGYGSPEMVREAEGLTRKLEARQAELGAARVDALRVAYERQFAQQALVHWRGRRYDKASAALARLAPTADPAVAARVAADLAASRRLEQLWADLGRALAAATGKPATLAGRPLTLGRVAEGALTVTVSVPVDGAPVPLSVKVPLASLPAAWLQPWLARAGVDEGTGAGCALLALWSYAEGLLGEAERRLDQAAGLGAKGDDLRRRLQAARKAGRDGEAAAELSELAAVAEPLAGLALLARWRARFGDTHVAATRQAELAALEARLAARLVELAKKARPVKDPGGDLPPVEAVLLHHRPTVQRKDGYTVIRYDFRTAAEQRDWVIDGRGWRAGRGQMTGGPNGSLGWRPRIRGDFTLTLVVQGPRGLRDVGIRLDAPDAAGRGYRVVVKATRGVPVARENQGESVLQSLAESPEDLDRTREPQRPSDRRSQLVIQRIGRRWWITLDGKPLLTGSNGDHDQLRLRLELLDASAQLRLFQVSFQGWLAPEPKK